MEKQFGVGRTYEHPRYPAGTPVSIDVSILLDHAWHALAGKTSVACAAEPEYVDTRLHTIVPVEMPGVSPELNYYLIPEMYVKAVGR